jgi:hypothetical protein
MNPHNYIHLIFDKGAKNNGDKTASSKNVAGYHSWGYTQKTVTQVTPEAPEHPCLLRHYSQ